MLYPIGIIYQSGCREIPAWLPGIAELYSAGAIPGSGFRFLPRGITRNRQDFFSVTGEVLRRGTGTLCGSHAGPDIVSAPAIPKSSEKNHQADLKHNGPGISRAVTFAKTDAPFQAISHFPPAHATASTNLVSSLCSSIMV